MSAALARLTVLALALLMWGAPAQAQEDPPAEAEVTAEEPDEDEDDGGFELSLETALGFWDIEEGGPAWDDLFTDPDMLNGALGVLAPKAGLRNFLKDTNLRFKTFEGTDGSASLGFEYDFDKSIVSPENTQGDEDRFLYGATFYGRGNVAFDQDINPNDFLETGFRFNAFRHSFKSALQNPITPEIQTQTQDFFIKVAEQDIDPEDYADDPDWQAIKKNIRGILGRDVLIDFSGHGTLESNQDFSSSQLVFGLQAGMVAREWNKNAPLSRLNVFDYPTALLRVMTGMEEEFTPTGTALPTISIGLDAVDPQDNDARAAVGKSDTYTRFRSEVSMKSRVGILKDQVVWASLGWRYYREFDAPRAIEAADLDEHSYFAAKIDLPGGMYLSYSAGKLPLDVDADSILALGFQTSF